MNSQKHEEVRKRRAKANTTRFNPYQKMVLVAGGLTLFSLAAGISPRLGPLLVAGVIGGMVVFFLIFKTFRRKRESEVKDAERESLPGGDESVELQPVSDPPVSAPEEVNSAGVQESIPLDSGREAEAEELDPRQNLSLEGILALLQERLAMAEGRLCELEGRLMELTDQITNYQEGQLKSESKIDLQTILAHLEEKKGKVL